MYKVNNGRVLVTLSRGLNGKLKTNFYSGEVNSVKMCVPGSSLQYLHSYHIHLPTELLRAGIFQLAYYFIIPQE